MRNNLNVRTFPHNKQIISKVNKHFHETADESQFVVTPVDATFGNNKAGVAPPPGKATKPGDLRSERHVTLVLYEYVHQTSATPGSKGALTKMASFSSQNSLASHSSFSFGDQQEEVFVGFTAAVPPTTSAKLTVGSASFKAPLPPATGAVAAVGATGEKSKEQGVPPRSAKMEHSRSWRAATPPILTTEGGGGGGGATVVGGRPQMERRRSVGAIVSSTPAKSSGKPFSVAPTPDTQDGTKKGWLTRQLSAKKN